MNVSLGNIEKAVKSLRGGRYLGIDTEGYGLEFNDRLFAISIANEKACHYFNFLDAEDYLGNKSPSNYILPMEALEYLLPLTCDPNKTWFIHNASHDLQKLSYEDIELIGDVICTQVSERVLYNNLLPNQYSLAKCASRRGWEKLDLVEECVSKNKLYTKIKVPGKKKMETRKHYNKVPFEILSEYAHRDALLHLKLGLSQLKELGEHE